MNESMIRLRALDSKTSSLRSLVPVIPLHVSWIKTLREALGMTARQLAGRIGVSQSRVAYMEQNEENLKISTLKKVAQSMNCTFVPLFIPNESLESMVRKQAKSKAKKMLASVNQNMALENQLSLSEEILKDMTEELISKSLKKIWD